MKIKTKELFKATFSKTEKDIIEGAIVAKIYVLADVLLDYEAYKVATKTHFEILQAISPNKPNPVAMWDLGQKDKSILPWLDKIPTRDCMVLVRIGSKDDNNYRQYFIGQVRNETISFELSIPSKPNQVLHYLLLP